MFLYSLFSRKVKRMRKWTGRCGMISRLVFSLILMSAIATETVAQEQSWWSENEQVRQKYNITNRERPDMGETGVISNLTPGQVAALTSLPAVEFAPGVTGHMYWGKGVLVNFMTMEPNAELPRETLPCERLIIMQRGSINQLVKGKFEEMKFTEVAPMYYFGTGYLGTIDCIYLEKGTENAAKAGPRGAEFIEFYAPVRPDYIRKYGAEAPANPVSPNNAAEPNFPPNVIFNYHDIQLVEIAPDAWGKLINGRGFQISATSCEPNTRFGIHNHPEEQIMTVLRGNAQVFPLGSPKTMNVGDVVYYPSQMIHATLNGPKGADVIDVFWPVRNDYFTKMKARRTAYRSIVPAGEQTKLIADGQTTTATNSKKKPGLQFTEGPTWMDGTLYFSSMYFDIPAGTWRSDERRSDLVAMKPDGTYKYISSGMQTNGLMAKGNGNLVACDMNGHRVIEINPEGKVVDVLASIIKSGVRLDAPNDLAIDAKGGIYFTDPQFMFTPTMRPSKTVNYIKPDVRETICVIENSGNQEFNMPNGVILSPDGKTLYVNNTYHMCGKLSEAENWIYAYDVNDDGTLSNKRRFAKLFLPSVEYETWSKSSCADGLTMDSLGNLYVATNIGLQIFNPKGEFIGNIHTPTFPVSCCFGGSDFKTIYMTCWDKVYAIHTNVRGHEFPLK